MSTSNNSGNTQPGVLVDSGARGALGSLVVDAFRRRGWLVYQAGRTPSASGDFRHVDLYGAVDGRTRRGRRRRRSDNRARREPGCRTARPASRRRPAEPVGEPAAATETLRQEAGARGTVLMNAGIAPGVTNLVAAALS